MIFKHFLQSICFSLAFSSVVAAEPQPGDVFREFTYPIRISEIDPATTLPNLQPRIPTVQSAHNMDLDLKGAKKAEVALEYWGGHIGTAGQAFSVNGSDWIPIPQPQGTPSPPQCYYRTLLKATVPIPLALLKDGANTFRFKAGTQICHGFDWGLYWVYAFTARVYLDETTSHPSGRISSHSDGDEVSDNPLFAAAAEGKESGISHVEFFGKYDDYNWEGDGVFRQWHYTLDLGQMRNHIGSVSTAPYAVKWNTQWIPDQDQPVEVAARITDRFGVTYVTPAVHLTLVRHGRSVRMFKASEMPEKFGVRTGRRMSCKISISGPLTQGRAARLVLSTWSAAHSEEIKLNDRLLASRVGYVHNQSFDSLPIAVKWLREGDNEFSIFSSTKEHAAEINWPGPALLVEFVPERAKTPSAWLAPAAPVRVSVQVRPGNHDRFDLPVEVPLNLSSSGLSVAAPVRVVEVNAAGEVTGPNVAFQYDPKTANGGTLLIALTGTTSESSPRYFDVYCAQGKPISPTKSSLAVTEVDWQGQPSFRIQTPAATYIYHKEGAGLASLIDPNGADWISYRPGGGSAGEYRGIPNLENGFGHPGNTGANGATSRIVSQGPLRVRILSEGHDKRWACLWDFYPGFARFTLLRNPVPYWVLYEGTPAGKLNTGTGWLRLSNEDYRSLAEPWAATLQGPKWAAFGDPDSKYFLFLADHQTGDEGDQYWPMEGNMTVFGYGREYNCCHHLLTESPARFSVAIVPRSTPGMERKKIESVLQDVQVLAGAVETLPLR